MRETKMEKGITLIALILTIVILLILAIVAINSITNDGLLGKAENATGTYNNSVTNEQEKITGYEGFLGKYTGGNIWTQDKTTVTNGKVTLDVGKTVTGYDAGVSLYTGGWAVLGAENGKLLLVSKVNVSSLRLSGKDGYYNGISKLNEACQSYLNSSLADEVRSIKVEDINRVTGYKPEKTGDGKIYGEGEPYQYGNTVTYTLNSGGNVEYKIGSNASKESSQTKFVYVDETALTTSNPIEVESNDYSYYPTSLTTKNSTLLKKGIASTSDAYKVLFLDSTGKTKDKYWLGNSFARADKGYAFWGIRYVYEGYVGGGRLWGSHVAVDVGWDYGVRAVVVLKSIVNIDDSGVIS